MVSDEDGRPYAGNPFKARDNAKWWNSRFQAERMNEEKEIEEAKTRHPSMRGK